MVVTEINSLSLRNGRNSMFGQHVKFPDFLLIILDCFCFLRVTPNFKDSGHPGKIGGLVLNQNADTHRNVLAVITILQSFPPSVDDTVKRGG